MMSQFGNFSNGSSTRGFSGTARILCRRADGAVELLKVCQSLAEALAECNLLIDRHLAYLKTNRAVVSARTSRPREIYVERWVGTDSQGAWTEVRRGDYIGQVYGRMNQQGKLELITPRVRFEFLDQPPRLNNGRTKNAHQAATVEQPEARLAISDTIDTSTLHNGAIVACVLLGRTKKGGWFARLACGAASGPITNADQIPASSQVGQTVMLRLNGINLDKKFASFRWVPPKVSKPTTDSRAS